MVKIRRTVYTKEFKRDAVRLVIEEGLSQAEACRRLGINQNSLSKWVRAFKETGGGAFPGKGHQTPKQEEIKRLREENRTLRMERDILKKATLISTRQCNSSLFSTSAGVLRPRVFRGRPLSSAAILSSSF